MASTIGHSTQPKYNAFYLSAEGIDYEDLEERRSKYMSDEESRMRIAAMKAGDGVGRFDVMRLVTPAEFIPKVARLTKGNRLCDYNSQGQVGPVVSAKFKAAHDKIQLGGNVFLPVKILHKNGSDYGGEFYVFYVSTFLDAINPTLGRFDEVRIAGEVLYRVKSRDVTDPNLRAIYKDQIAGKVAWVDIRFGSPYVFASDAFLRELRAAGAEVYDTSYMYFNET